MIGRLLQHLGLANSPTGPRKRTKSSTAFATGESRPLVSTWDNAFPGYIVDASAAELLINIEFLHQTIPQIHAQIEYPPVHYRDNLGKLVQESNFDVGTILATYKLCLETVDYPPISEIRQVLDSLWATYSSLPRKVNNYDEAIEFRDSLRNWSRMGFKILPILEVEEQRDNSEGFKHPGVVT